MRRPLKLKPEARYLVYCEAELDKDYHRKQWYTASYHTDGAKKVWFFLEHPSYWLNKSNAGRCFKKPSDILAVRPMPKEPEL